MVSIWKTNSPCVPNRRTLDVRSWICHPLRFLWLIFFAFALDLLAPCKFPCKSSIRVFVSPPLVKQRDIRRVIRGIVISWSTKIWSLLGSCPLKDSSLGNGCARYGLRWCTTCGFFGAYMTPYNTPSKIYIYIYGVPHSNNFNVSNQAHITNNN